jgi:hypothetical protein
VAILIAIAGVLDPAMTSTRRTRPEVALVAGTADGDAALARRVAQELDGAFTVIEAPFTGAAGTVIVGTRLPASANELASPVMAVLPERTGPTVTVEGVDAPAAAPLDARTGVAVMTRATGAKGRRVEISLRAGELVVDRISMDVTSDDQRRRSELAFVPTALGAAPLRVTAEIAGTGTRAAADVVVDIHDQRWAVLFFDPRPSWMSTFVRRAIERDPRFVVTSRVVTSRNLSTDAGRPPATLDDLGALSLFDAIVVGASDALGDRDVAGLDAYLRRRGGTVILMLDQRAAGAYSRLTGVREWAGATNSAGFAMMPRGGDSVGLRASEIAWPRTIPAGARVLADARPLSGDTTVRHPVIWRSAVGAGQVIVSGALDAWRYRDRATPGFDAFWRTSIASAADAATAPVAITLDRAILAPGERTGMGVALRDAALTSVTSNRGVRASVTASLETPAGILPIRLWPDGMVGSFRGSVRAPAAPGSYRIVVTGDGSRADVPVVVATSIARPVADDADLVGAWAGSRGGRGIEASQLAQLVPSLERVLRPVPRRETWYPMRSVWWIVPFTLALGAEWLWRRRRGLA